MKSYRIDESYIYNVTRDQSAYLEFMASEVMPAIDRTFKRQAFDDKDYSWI